MEFRAADLTDARIIDLVRLHQQNMLDVSPPGTSYALDLAATATPDISLFAIWDGEVPVALGALKEISAVHGELKSMRVVPSHLGKGLGKRMLTHLLELARSRGYTRVSLETGSGSKFEAATQLYVKAGFRQGDVFGDYTPSPDNLFYHLEF